MKSHTIRYYTRNKFGRDLKFPIDHIEALYTLMRRKTLEDRDIKALKSVGFSLVEVLESSVSDE